MTFENSAQFTVYFIWWVGAVFAIILLLGLIAVSLVMMMNVWRERIYEDVCLNLWAYRAMRAYQRAGHPRPDMAPMVEEQQKLQRVANHLIDNARAQGYVVTIETEPLQPLRMGNYVMVANVRKVVYPQPTQQ